MPERSTKFYFVSKNADNKHLALLIQRDKESESSDSDSINAAAQTDTQLEWWPRLLGVFYLVVVFACAVTCGATAGAFKCRVATIAAGQFSDTPSPWGSTPILQLAMQTAVWFEATLLLAAATATLAWNAVLLLHPLLSEGRPELQKEIDALPLSERMARVVERTGTVLAALVSVVLMQWYALYAYDYITPASCVELILLIGILGLSTVLFFSMACGGFALSKAALLSATAQAQQQRSR